MDIFYLVYVGNFIVFLVKKFYFVVYFLFVVIDGDFYFNFLFIFFFGYWYSDVRYIVMFMNEGFLIVFDGIYWVG